MAFKGRGLADVDFNSLLVSLNNSKLQTQNPALYQTIDLLIRKLRQQQLNINQTFRSVIGDVEVLDLPFDIVSIIEIINQLINATYLTAENESSILSFSRQLLAGTGITFDDTIPNERTISSTGGAGSFIPMVNGAQPPELMNNGDSDLLLTGYTP